MGPLLFGEAVTVSRFGFCAQSAYNFCIMPAAVEIEARFINLDRGEIERKLMALGAKKEFESFFKEWIFAYDEWLPHRKRIRVRDDGKNVWLTYKANPTWEVDSTEEIEIKSSSSSNTAKILEKIGVPMIRYQEKKRIEYKLGDATIELDFWPKIPMVLEIEAPSKESVIAAAKLLGLKWEDAIFVDQKFLHNDYYGIDLDLVKEYKF
jgi:adenylate cyclase class 2